MQTANLEALESDDLFVKATELAEKVQGLYPFVRETPRWEVLFDQAQRAAASIPLKYCEGLAKLKGYCQAGWLCSRGSAYELFAALSIGPPPFRELKPAAVEVICLLDAAVLALPEKCERPYWKN